MTREDLDEFSNKVLKECLDYVEKLPETVHSVSDLLTIVIHRNGEKFCYKLLNTLAEEVRKFSTFQLSQLNKFYKEETVPWPCMIFRC